jgi:hypothetical protein
VKIVEKVTSVTDHSVAVPVRPSGKELQERKKEREKESLQN